MISASKTAFSHYYPKILRPKVTKQGNQRHFKYQLTKFDLLGIDLSQRGLKCILPITCQLNF